MGTENPEKMSKIEVNLIKNGIDYNISDIVTHLQWAGKNKTSARSLSFGMLDTSFLNDIKMQIKLDDGIKCRFKYDSKELFRGMLFDSARSEKPTASLVAYDNAIRLKNKDSFSYTDKTAGYIFNDVCKRFSIPYKPAPNTGFIIDELPKSKTTGYDAISDALSLTYKATQKRYSVFCDGDYVTLVRRKNQIVQWVIEACVNLESYSYKESLSKIVTRVQIYNDDNSIVASKVNSALEEKIGVFQDIDTAMDDMTKSDIQALIDAIIDENGSVLKTISVKATGITDVISGRGVYIIIPKLNLSRTFYVESDTHKFEKNKHSMSLSLTAAMDLDIEDES